jgi:catechol 2,3-dioxygenase-like lactoylglutathione lyase family enzyme
MIDHLTLTVRDFEGARRFYSAALEPLGYAVRMEFGQYLGFGPPGKPAFWIKPGSPTQSMHLAFMARDRRSVDAFHAAALAAGARDNGPPGIRADYHPHYYGAFVIDPEGHNVEAVCHRPAPARAKPARRKAAGRKPVSRKRPR